MFICLPTKQRVGEEEEEPAAERDREDTLKLECVYVTAAQTLTLYTLVYVNRNAWALQIAKKLSCYTDVTGMKFSHCQKVNQYFHKSHI